MFNKRLFFEGDDLKIKQICGYCEEEVNKGQKYCADCSTQAKRKIIFDETAKIWKENAKLGYLIPTELKNWQ